MLLVKETYSSTASSVHTELSSLHSRTTSFNGEGTSMHSGNTLERGSMNAHFLIIVTQDKIALKRISIDCGYASEEMFNQLLG